MGLYATEETITHYISILVQCALSGKCTGKQHINAIHNLNHRLDAMRYYKQHGVDIPL